LHTIASSCSLYRRGGGAPAGSGEDSLMVSPAGKWRHTGQGTVHVRCAPDTQAGPQVRSSNGQNPTAVRTWQGAPDCPVRHRAVSLPTATFGGWGYKYPNHPTIHCIQVLYFPTITRALAFNSRHTKEIKSSPYPTQRPSD
jgi:hypothetical protein